MESGGFCHEQGLSFQRGQANLFEAIGPDSSTVVHKLLLFMVKWKKF